MVKMGNLLAVSKEKIRVALKVLFEYKANLYSVFIFDFFLVFAYGFFYFIFGEFIFEILGWSNYDFILYFIAVFLSSKCKWGLSLMFFSSRLLNGKLNTLLTKPVNPYFYQTLFYDRGGSNIIYVPFLFVVFFIVSLFLNYNIYLSLISMLVILLGILLEILVINFLESLAFFIKKNEFLVNLFLNVLFFNETYTPKLMASMTNLFYLLPTSIYGFFVIELLNNRYDLFLTLLPWFILSCVVLSVLIKLLWVFGLKRYEAYG